MLVFIIKVIIVSVSIKNGMDFQNGGIQFLFSRLGDNLHGTICHTAGYPNTYSLSHLVKIILSRSYGLQHSAKDY
jgi:hypothetical protein